MEEPKKDDTPKPLMLELTGEVEFNLGNSDEPIDVSISIGYRKTYPKIEFTNKSSGNDNPGSNTLASKDQLTPTPETFVYASLTAAGKGVITINDLIRSTVTSGKVPELPDFLDDVGFRKFSVTYGKGGLGASKFTIEFDSRVVINNKKFDIRLAVYRSVDDKGNVVLSFGGILHVDQHQFNILITKSDTWYLFAGYRNEGTFKVDINAIAAKFFSADTVQKMPKLSFNVDKLTAFLLYKGGQQKAVLFGMGAGVDIDLNKLPLVGSVLSKGKSFQFKEVLGIYSTGDFPDTLIKNYDLIPQGKIVKGFNISTQILVDGKPEYYIFNSGEDQSANQAALDAPISIPGEKITGKPNDPPPDPPADSAPPPLDGGTSDASWKKLDKTIGPVTFQRLGFMFKDGKVVVLLDASMQMAGMGMQLMGFGLGFKLAWPPPAPDFYIEGIGISFKMPPIEVEGAFLHKTEKFKDQTIHVYNGGVILKIFSFTISAIGSYAKVKDDKGKEVSSLFIYGVFDGTIGGPVFFIVTGIAAGFGYNRRVNVPSVDEVALYPLVALAMKPDKSLSLLDILASLEKPMKNKKKPIEISIGDYWLAIGIKFSSFKLIESFVLVTVNFGTDLEFAILGLSRLRWPEESISPKAIVYIEMAILIHFGPASDVISVEAVITPNSFILYKDCKLTGGFAFYVWTKGPHEGDFVITLGGYHTKFKKPAWYPVVPRLGLNWKVSDVLMIKGEMYFALTSTAIMAGGRWEVLFHIPVVTAQFIVWADMLIAWAPFQYDLSVGIYLRIEINIRIAFIHIHFTIELGASLHIWGPPFSGEAKVYLVIFSFTIPFGHSGKEEPAPLKWEEFSSSFIPQANSKPEPINITISNGLIDSKGENKFPIINPHQLAISIESFIPVTDLTFNGAVPDDKTPIKSTTRKDVFHYDVREQKVGIRPCGFDHEVDKMQFSMKVNCFLEGEKVKKIGFTCTSKGIPEALWGPSKSTNSNEDPGTSEIMRDVLCGLILHPLPSPPGATEKEFDFSKLFDATSIPFRWQVQQLRSGEAYHSTEVFETLKTYDQPDVVNNRDAILALLKENFDSSLPDISKNEINEIMNDGIHYFKSAPVLCAIGEIPQYPTDTKIKPR